MAGRPVVVEDLSDPTSGIKQESNETPAVRPRAPERRTALCLWGSADRQRQRPPRQASSNRPGSADVRTDAQWMNSLSDSHSIKLVLNPMFGPTALPVWCMRLIEMMEAGRDRTSRLLEFEPEAPPLQVAHADRCVR